MNIYIYAAETDLKKLQQQYRKAEEAKRAYTKKTQALIYRDEREIQRLLDEHERLLSSLRVLESSYNQRNDASVVQDLTAMLARDDRIDEELKAEKGKLASLKDQASKYFSKLMNMNGELREELKTLQMEKELFLHDKSRLKKELNALRKDISNLMTECTEAFNNSVKIQEKQRMLRDQEAEDVAHYIKEKSKLEQEVSPHCYLDTKAIVRTNQNINHRKVEYKKMEGKELGLEDFEEAIKQILRETEEGDLDKLIRNFIQMEEQNYTLLRFVNYQRNEAEGIRRQISQLCSQRERFVAEGQEQQEQNQAHQIKLSIKQEASEHQLAVYQQRVEFMEKLLDLLKEGLESLLQISYGSSVICSQLDSSEGVQDENIIEYLRKMEDRFNELLTLQSYLHFQEKLNNWDVNNLSTMAEQLLGITPPAVSLTTAAVTPAPDDDPDLVEPVLLEAKEPLNREDLLTLVDKRYTTLLSSRERSASNTSK
ncbi:coiled-coil domain-containing protein 63-like [Symphorus nematophorus]